MNVQAFIAALNKHKGKVIAAVAANGAVFGLDLGEAFGTLVDQISAALSSGLGAYAALALAVQALLEALKGDPDIDTGSTTPGPDSDVK